ncbi:MAG: hypothetical protein BWK74_02635 [Desulfobacteraceae bacterium A6]|nr:MAG: hypothetical protein BWK74_02635 [Desulfobacteraceae bacterium A6]
MKFIKFILLAVGAFMVLIALLWVVIHLWWLILALVALFISYVFMRENKKEEETKSDQPGEKASTSNHPFEND